MAEVADAPVTLPATSPWTRVVSLLSLAGVLGLIAWAGTEVYLAMTDAWIAPLRLSPNDDAVMQARVRLTSQLAERDKLRAEVEFARAQAEVLDEEYARLATLLDAADGALSWSDDELGSEIRAVGDLLGRMRDERVALVDIQAREVERLERARANLSLGLVTEAEVAGAEAAVDRVALELLTLDRTVAASEVEHARWVRRRRGISATVTPEARVSPERGQHHEQRLRVSVELARINAERRRQAELVRVATNTLEATEQLLEELRERPIYRAMEARTDIAFVPYDAAEDVDEGGRVLACVWGVILCRDVGRVAELIPGEVVTEGPWGERERGRYAALLLDEADAFMERTLRVRLR
ncbi:MAG: hypothetical protein H6726_25785 [Sandaracinaceae bacterium]|nr:hypothetical protein [Myxococcales bacterium]MCB9661085.1 hypothetical protein [Sandaracinaceae bacterium]